MGAITAELVETGERRDALGRRKTPQERREELVEAYRKSGLTMMQMARREGLKYSTFAGWVWRSGRIGAKSARSPGIKFTEVKMPAMAAPLEVRLADGTVVRGDPASIATLIKSLRS